MGAADGEGGAVFQDDRTILHLHDVDHVDDAAPVDEDELLRGQLHPGAAGISMASRIRSKKNPSSAMS